MVRVPPSSSSHFGDVDKVWVLGCDCVLEGALGLRRRGECKGVTASHCRPSQDIPAVFWTAIVIGVTLSVLD